MCCHENKRYLYSRKNTILHVVGLSAGNALTFWQVPVPISPKRLTIELRNLVHRCMLQSCLTTLSFTSIDFMIHVV